MFGFGLKDKAKKILENDIGVHRPVPSWLNSIVKQGKKQNFNEYDIAINYCMTEWEFNIDQALKLDFDKEIKETYYKNIQSQRHNLKKIEHLAHQDMPVSDRINQIIKDSKKLIK